MSDRGCSATSAVIGYHLTPSAQNPFAWDVPNVDGCVNTEPFDELEWLTPYLRVNYAISTVFGGIFSLYLLYLVVFHTTESLVPYKKIILCCAITDVMYWFIENFCQFKAKQVDGVFLLKLDGPARFFNREYQVLTTAIYVTAICLVNTLLPAQTYFRYYALTRSKILGQWKTLLLFTFSILAILPIFITSYHDYSNSPATRPGFNYGSLWFKEYPLPILIIGDVRDVWHTSFFVYGVICSFMCYSLTLLIGFKTLKSLRILQNTCSKRTKVLQIQLSRYLMLQATIQLITSVAPVSVIIFSGFSRWDTGMTPTFCIVALSWIPIINPLLTMIVIVPYRKVARKTLGRVVGNGKIMASSSH